MVSDGIMHLGADVFIYALVPEVNSAVAQTKELYVQLFLSAAMEKSGKYIVLPCIKLSNRSTNLGSVSKLYTLFRQTSHSI